ncbi:nuclear pore glycoprotein p62-like isoform X2 [Brachypodium distachyon]|uniref:nuclear pore glycoprotein p62-like isoform X2 n=1 Tax=Brachypodium distachyon TaxID=15368 RepID=UPI000D0E27F0|nr:nuclear pore glycoprotein p62-like isoform X2 [Brachypodium distachyon]|eukprot:XP_024314929.1 nuclear pore glycoprotein p62-like isoform X2 [Brachypodium distachyon]
MKAMREFAMAEPKNCHKEWTAYMALVKAKETAALASPTSATSPPHSRACPVATSASVSSTNVPATGRAATATPFTTAPHTESPKDKWAAKFEALIDEALVAIRAEWKAAANSQGTSSPTTSSHAPAAEALDSTPALVRPVSTVAPAASFTPDPAATTATGLSLPAPGYAASASCDIDIDIDIILKTPATCSTDCLQGNTSAASTLGVPCVGQAPSMVSDTIFNAESPAIGSTVCPSQEKDMTQQLDVGLVASSATEGIELSNTLMVPRPLKFFIVQNVTALVFGLLDIGLHIDIALKGHNSDSASSLLIKTHTWCRLSDCADHDGGPGLKPSEEGKLLHAGILVSPPLTTLPSPRTGIFS